jgi:uncharacterized membrane protein YkvA (DUF1232 family)
MSDNRTPTIYDDNIIKSLIRQLRLAWRLFLDPRVSWMTKALPVIAGIYVISPVDLIMGVPVLSGMDDLAVAVLGLKLFIEFSPPEVVQEHMRQLQASVSTWRVVDDAPPGEGGAEHRESAIVEGQYSVVEDEPPKVSNEG